MAEVFGSVDLGGTKIACAFATREGEVLGELTAPTHSHEGPEAVLARIAALVEELARETDARPAAIGVGVPGLADIRQGVTRFLPNLPTNWRDVPVRATLEPRLGCRVYLLNDARMAALGELTFGLGRSAATMIYYTLGTGIGGGVAVEGKLRLGVLGAAGELGHQTILPDGPLCGCGNRGCLETLASGPAIAAQGVWLLNCGRAPKLHELVGGDAGRVTPKEMAEAAAAGDEGVRDVLLRAFEYLGIGVANLVTALHPDLVVFSGGMVELGAPLFDVVRETVRRRVGMLPTDGVRIERSALGDKAGMWGGIALAMNHGLQ